MTTLVKDAEFAREAFMHARGGSLFFWAPEFSFEFRITDILAAIAKEVGRTLTPFDAPLAIATPEQMAAQLEFGYASDLDNA